MADYPDSTGARHQWWETLNRKKLQSVVFLPSEVVFLCNNVIFFSYQKNILLYNLEYVLLFAWYFYINKYFCVQITVIQTKEQVSDLFKTRSLLNCNTY